MSSASADPKPLSWRPPTPDSILTPLPAPPPPLGHIEPLPPPLTSLPTLSSPSKSLAPGVRARNSASISRLLNDAESGDTFKSEGAEVATARATPRSLASRDDALARSQSQYLPARGYFAEDSTLARPALELNETKLSPLVKPTVHDDDDDDLYSTSIRKRPRREASVAAKLALRQPSPLDLSPPLRATGGGSQSNRKVSHSLIERRRREKINDCLAALKTMVPQCREEGERKEARARERGRKRGRRGDEVEEEGSRGGLHKLEILQGTIAYIEELEARISILEDESPAPGRLHHEPSASTSDTPGSSPEVALQDTLPTPPVIRRPSPIPEDAPHPASRTESSTSASSSVTFVPNDEDSAALLLLKFSTSPELRPVFFD